MFKSFLKLLLYESIMMMVLIIAACIAVLIQMLFGVKTGTDSSFFFSSTYYDYNLLMYILGLVIYFFVMITIIKKFGGKLDFIKKLGNAYKVMACIYDLIWGFAMFAFLGLLHFHVLGMTISYKPEILCLFSFVGLPVITALSIGFVLIKSCLKK